MNYVCKLDASRVTVNATGCGFVSYSKKQMYLYNFFALVSRKTVALSFATQYLQNSAESGERSVLTLGSLCLACSETEKKYMSIYICVFNRKLDFWIAAWPVTAAEIYERAHFKGSQGWVNIRVKHLFNFPSFSFRILTLIKYIRSTCAKKQWLLSNISCLMVFVISIIVHRWCRGALYSFIASLIIFFILLVPSLWWILSKVRIL